MSLIPAYLHTKLQGLHVVRPLSPNITAAQSSSPHSSFFTVAILAQGSRSWHKAPVRTGCTRCSLTVRPSMSSAAVCGSNASWVAAPGRLWCNRSAASAGRFFTSGPDTEAGIGSLEWRPGRPMPTEVGGHARTTALAPKSALAAEPGRMEGNTVLYPPASADPGVVAQAKGVVDRWKSVMLPPWTAIVTGPESARLDFTFVPELMDGAERENTQQSFETLIVALVNLVAFEEGKATGGGQYVRRIGYHKLGQERGVEDYTYLFRHCGSARLCVTLQREGRDKVLLYGYNGMGLHRCHPSWWSLVVRSRSAGLTARLLRVLGPPCRRQDFIDGVSYGCARSYEECMDIISRCLAARGVGLSFTGACVARGGPTEEVGASTDGSEESEGGGLHGGGPDEATVWTDGEE